MKLSLSDKKTGGELLLFSSEPQLDRHYYLRDKDNKYFTIAWNTGIQQTVTIDGGEYDFMPGTILPLMFNQSFSFGRAEDIVAWQFNREFYCIIDHDAEVSCVGFLFAGADQVFINTDEQDQARLRLLLHIFIEELKTRDNIQNDLLLLLLKRLIIVITKLAKSSAVPDQNKTNDKLDIFRQFNLLVEANFNREHSVQYYADRLHKSPKTLANIFLIYNEKTPIQMIHTRIMIEAKRLLYYTSKSIKQITYELGFEDPAYFTNFFKRNTAQSPVEFRKSKQIGVVGK
ncbi:MAG TPA: helix-turn-helix domain-containing protein [Chitinophagaceae bacterium]|nr:helix-turn-helix domain-containing protein [Chitinophagaceae bacterium]